MELSLLFLLVRLDEHDLTLIASLTVIIGALFYNRMKYDDEDESVIIVPEALPTDLEEGQSRIAEPRSELLSEAVAAATAATVATKSLSKVEEMEFEVPPTPQFSMSDVSDNSAAMSSFTESPCTTVKSPAYGLGLDYNSPATPSTPGLGIGKPNLYRATGDLNLGFAAEKYQPKHWKIYKNDSMMDSV